MHCLHVWVEQSAVLSELALCLLSTIGHDSWGHVLRWYKLACHCQIQCVFLFLGGLKLQWVAGMEFGQVVSRFFSGECMPPFSVSENRT